ncbi:uncharacterized protein CCOS01_06189, partial [Colletotrichum costaricense]
DASLRHRGPFVVLVAASTKRKTLGGKVTWGVTGEGQVPQRPKARCPSVQWNLGVLWQNGLLARIPNAWGSRHMQSATCNPPLRRPSLEEHRSVFNHSQPSRFPTRRPSRNLSVVVLCRGSQEVHPSSPRTTIDEPNANVDGSQQGFSQLSNAFLPGYLSVWSN